MEEILTAPVQRAFAPPTPPAGIHTSDAHQLCRFDSFSAVPPGPSSRTSEPGRAVSIDVLRDVVIELIYALNSMLNEELESAVGSVQRSAALLQVSSRLTGFAITKMANPLASGGLAPWQARIVKTHIDTNLHGSLRSKDLARLVQLSTFHFCRVFRVSFGQSPHTYVMRRRIERAQGLILTTNLRLSQIALDCGFADQAHFSKQFRRHSGESPGEWRRRRASGANEATLAITHSSGAGTEKETHRCSRFS